MSSKEGRRAWVPSPLTAGGLSAAEAARLLGLAERTIGRTLARLDRDGPAGLVYGNRDRPSPRRVTDEAQTRVMSLVERTTTDSDIALRGAEGITIGRIAEQQHRRSVALTDAVFSH